MDSLEELVVFRGLWEDPVVARAAELFARLAATGEEPREGRPRAGARRAPAGSAAGAAYRGLLFALAEAIARPGSLTRRLLAADPRLTPWQAHLAGLVLTQENPVSVSLQVARDSGAVGAGGPSLPRPAAPPLLTPLLKWELQRLAVLFHGAGDLLTRLGPPAGPHRPAAAAGGRPGVPVHGAWGPPVVALRGLVGEGEPGTDLVPAAWREALDTMLQDLRWERVGPLLVRVYQSIGCGTLARHAAFRWDGGRLLPVEDPDAPSLDTFIGYEEPRREVLENTRRLVEGLPAHHVLLYGPRGVGKSATVRAVWRHFAPAGLRLVEVPAAAVPSLAEIVESLGGARRPTLLFVDDLSLAGEGPALSALKAALEGSLSPLPSHVRVYATSNRRHLVPEPAWTLEATPGDGRPGDTRESLFSLADRFGLVVFFPPADQQQFLEIVRGLLPEEPGEEQWATVRAAALHWSRWRGGLSPRSARQFVQEYSALSSQDGRWAPNGPETEGPGRL